MRPFQPTVRPLYRLTRLGVVLDPRNPLDRQHQIGRMCELANIDAVWAYGGTDPLATLTAIAQDTGRLQLGLAMDAPPLVPDDLLATLDGFAAPDRLELTLTDSEISPSVLERLHNRGRLGLRLALTLAPATETNSQAARWGPADVTSAAVARVVRFADDAVLSSVGLGGLPPVAEIVGLLRAECVAQGRDPTTLGTALDVPVSVGRTTAEASARAAAEPLFDLPSVGQPAEVGIFGTLEECQARVAELAHSGVTDLRCSLPNAPDLPDVIAQLTAMVVGRLDLLTPGTPRSRPPDPPATWGGRSRFPNWSDPSR